MEKPLISEEQLAKAPAVLFVTRLAIGDFVYLQQCFRSFASQRPTTRIHLWINDTRTSWRFWRWRRTRQDILYQWLGACPFIEKVYEQPYSLCNLFRTVREAQVRNYAVVVALSPVRPWVYALLAQLVSPRGFRAGLHRRSRHLDVLKRWAYRSLDARLEAESPRGRHISEIYAARFSALFGVEVNERERRPILEIPREFSERAETFLAGRRKNQTRPAARTTIFVNPFSKEKKKSCSLKKVVALMELLRRSESWRAPLFVINVPPERFAATQEALVEFHDAVAFTALSHFYELPAMVAACDFVVSVDTATTHIASAASVPLVALMRMTNPEWAPLSCERTVILRPPHRDDAVEAISVDRIVDALHVLRPLSSTPFR